MGTWQELGERIEEHREEALMPGERAGGLLALTHQLPVLRLSRASSYKSPRRSMREEVPHENSKNSKGFLELIFLFWKAC